MTDLSILPFPPFEKFVRRLLLDNYPALTELDADASSLLVGGDFGFDPTTMPFFIRIDRIAGSTGQIQGDFPFDLEVFDADWDSAESRSADIEALLLGYPHVVEVDDRKMIFDHVSQNVGVFELPWEDDTVNRLGATYVITARRR